MAINSVYPKDDNFHMPSIAEATARANATSRHGGAVSGQAVVPRVMSALFDYWMGNDATTVLDFGAGKNAKHARALSGSYNHIFTAHDFGANVVQGIHDPDALNRTYDYVYASNVINTIMHGGLLQETISTLPSLLVQSGVGVINYPSSPRLLPLSTDAMCDQLAHFLPNLTRVMLKGYRGRLADAPAVYLFGHRQRIVEWSAEAVEADYR